MESMGTESREGRGPNGAAGVVFIGGCIREVYWGAIFKSPLFPKHRIRRARLRVELSRIPKRQFL